MRTTTPNPSILTLTATLALALTACDELPRPTVTDGRGERRPVAGAAPAVEAGSVPGNTVTLKFAWPEALEARVRYTLRGTAAAGQPETFFHTLTARKAGAGWEVDERGPLEGSDFTADELILRGELLAPSGITPEGALAGVLDAASDHERGLAAMRARFEAAGQLEMFESGAAKMYTPAVITRRSESIWRSMVGHWAGKTLTRGTKQPITFSSPVGPASASQRPLELTGTLEYVGATRCKRGDVVARCVALSLEASADPEAMAATVVESLTSAMLDDTQTARLKEMIRVEKASASRKVTLIADPNTLRPHKLTITQKLELSVALQRNPDEPPKRQESMLDHEVERVFSYP